MADDKSGAHPTQYACKCLNVGITSSPPPSPPPDGPHEPNYTPVFVQADGISVIHPQVTVRLLSRSESIPGTLKRSRFTVLRCLFCDLSIYGVYHTISPDIEGNASTLLPSEDWVEHEIMKSASGWIEVHKDSIVGERISEVKSSSSYASPFSVVLPPPSSLPELLPDPESSSETLDDATSSQTASPEVPMPEYLSHLRPLYLPPPFTPSNPIFVLLADLASKKSSVLREGAEQRIADFVKAETAGLEEEEKELKRQVDVLWQNFRHNLEIVQQDRARLVLNTTRSPIREAFVSSGVISPSQTASSMTVRNFVPESVSSAALTLSSSAPRVSALSASLATSKFHYPDRPERRLSATESTISVSSPRSISSTLVHTTPRGGGGSNVLQFNRNIDDNINTQASYWYFSNLEEEMKRYNQEVPKKRPSNQEAGPSIVNSTPKTNGNKHPPQPQIESRSPSAEKPEGENREITSPSPRDKGKRKVTFDIEPAVVTIKQERSKAADTEEPMMFPFEDSETQSEAEPSSSNAAWTQLPLLEQPPRPQRDRVVRYNSGMESFVALRPSSLPAPSNIRPVRSPPSVDSSSSSVIKTAPQPVVPPIDPPNSQSTASSSSPIPISETDAAILKLVAAYTPSHRGAWTPESKAWKMFTRREPQEDPEGIPEEGEDDENSSNSTQPIGILRSVGRKGNPGYDTGHSRLQGTAASAPISIALPKARQQLSAASYRPATVLSEEPELEESLALPSTGKKAPSSSSIRRALYAERDRARAFDPGFLDFVDLASGKDDEEQSEISEADLGKGQDGGEKGRKQALKILQARSELPAEGMWRSLA